MGIWDEIQELMSNMGMGNIGSTVYPTYPDLVRQFIASCQLTFENPHHHKAHEGRLSYKIDGRYYSLSLAELCEIYRFERRGDEVLTYYAFGDQAKFWTEIGSGHYYNVSETKQSAVRHPALRILAKLLSHTLLSKPEPGRMYQQELQMLYFACNGVITLDHPSPHLTFNMGAVFAAHLEHIKTRVLKGQGKNGMLLTLIFRYHRVPLGTHSIDTRIEEMDLGHLSRSHIFTDPRYEFFTRGMTRRGIILPNRDLTGISSVELLRFRPPERLLIDVPRRQGDPPPEAEEEPFDIAAHILPEQPADDCTETEWRVYSREPHRSQFRLLHHIVSLFSSYIAPHATQPSRAPAPRTDPTGRQSVDRPGRSVDTSSGRGPILRGGSSAAASRDRREDESATSSATSRERSRSPRTP